MGVCRLGWIECDATAPAGEEAHTMFAGNVGRGKEKTGRGVVNPIVAQSARLAWPS